MKRKRNQLFVTALTAAMAVSLLSPAEPAAAAKKVKFNVKTLSLTVGKKKTLKIKNAKKKAKWSINPEARYSLWGSMTNIQEDYLPRKIR